MVFMRLTSYLDHQFAILTPMADYWGIIVAQTEGYLNEIKQKNSLTAINRQTVLTGTPPRTPHQQKNI